jgi:hypothetical protein
VPEAATGKFSAPFGTDRRMQCLIVGHAQAFYNKNLCDILNISFSPSEIAAMQQCVAAPTAVI